METTLYKRGSNGTPQEWTIRLNSNGSIELFYGKVGGITHCDGVTVTMKSSLVEYQSRIDAKRKEGYKELQELYDNSPRFIEGNSLFSYLNDYLPKYNESIGGISLPMLAKTLEDNRPFEKYGQLRGQWKINGERCIIGAYKDDGDIFSPIKLKFHSRTGTPWNLPYLEAILLDNLPKDILDMMVDEGAELDGELYIPGYNINNINHFIKDPLCPQHKDLQYWIYDIAVDNMPYYIRRQILDENFLFDRNFLGKFDDINDHQNNRKYIVYLPEVCVNNIEEAVNIRNSFINLGFEGLILRNPNVEYDFGARRVGHMYKYKKILDGLFKIIDVIPEGSRRKNLGKFVLKNDINDELFECTYNAPQTTLEIILLAKDKYVGKKVKVEYRERSGVKQVPFHAKAIGEIL